MEDFVPYETVLKLEKKGYKGRNIRFRGHIYSVLKWLREEKKIYLELVIVVDTEYMCDIYKFDVKPIECIGSTDYFKTYELAAIAGIEYVIDNLI